MAHPEETVLANWITLSRFPLLVLIILILYQGSPPLRLLGRASCLWV